MTNKKITDFTRLESITGNEYLPIAQEFNNWKIDINQIKTFLGDQLLNGVVKTIDLAAGAGADLVGFKRPQASVTTQVFDLLSAKPIQDVEFGCIGDGLADDTSALNALMAAGLATGRAVSGRVGATYKISGTVNINCNADFGGCIFSAPVSLAGVAVKTSGVVAGVGQLNRISIRYPTVQNNRVAGVVPTAGSIGIQIQAARNCRFEFSTVYGFEENIQLYSNDGTTGFISYNNLYFNEIVFGSKINIHLKTESTGWVNQCAWFGGQFAQLSTDTAAFNTINLQITKADTGGNNPPNGHTFFGCSLEGAFTRTVKYNLNAGIVTSYFSCNTFINCRFEAAVNMELSALALYDTYVTCSGLNGATFVGSVFPNVLGGTRIFRNTTDITAIPGAASFRDATSIPFFQANNSGSAAVIAFGISNRINATVSASGAFQSYHPGNNTSLFPMVSVDVIGGVPGISLGDGTAAATEKLRRANAGDWRQNYSLSPVTDVTYTLGTSLLRYSNIYSNAFRPGAGSATWTSGAGTPEGSITALPGSMYTNTSGGAGTTLYVKETGSGNTGWVAK